MAPVASSKALNAILPQIPTSPYEAHQKARTFASRYVKSNQFDTAIDVLFQSARELFKNGQTGSGVDLTGFMLDVYETKAEAVSDESRGQSCPWIRSGTVILSIFCHRKTYSTHRLGRAFWWMAENHDRQVDSVSSSRILSLCSLSRVQLVS